MGHYAMLLLADLLLAGSFSAAKAYQKQEGISAEKGLLFNAIFGLFSAALMLLISGFRLEYSLYSIAMAFAFALLVTLYNLIGFRIMAKGTMALYTIFLMTGGMTIPYIWGVLFLGESLTLLRTLGLLVIAVAVLLSNFEKTRCDARQLLLCGLVFVLNGFVSVVSKEHQIHPGAVSTVSFVGLCGIAQFCISSVAWLLFKRKGTSAKPHAASLLAALAASVFSGFSSVLQLTGAKSLPATVLYPFITGGSILFIALAGCLLYKEKLSRRSLIGILLCVAGTCLFL